MMNVTMGLFGQDLENGDLKADVPFGPAEAERCPVPTGKRERIAHTLGSKLWRRRD